MPTVVTILSEWNDNQNNLPGDQALSDATNTLQIYAPDIINTEGNQWWIAVATYLSTDLSIVVNPTYISLRNYVDGNQVEADALFVGLQAGIEALTESAAVIASINKQDLVVEQNAISGNTAILEAEKTGGVNQQLDDALDKGIKFLERLDERIDNSLGN